MKGWTTESLAAMQQKQAAKKRRGETANGITAHEAKRRASVLIGIDPGVNTGLAIKEGGLIRILDTFTIWKALNIVKEWAEYHGKSRTFVRIEDARLRTWFGQTSRERLKGAGSVERDCKIWQEVLTELEIPHEFVHPRDVKATTADYFKRLTGWQGRTSKHAREACWLIL